MARLGINKDDYKSEKLAKHLKNPQKVLSLIGRPIFYLVLYSLYGLALIFASIYNFTKKSLFLILRSFQSLGGLGLSTVKKRQKTFRKMGKLNLPVASKLFTKLPPKKSRKREVKYEFIQQTLPPTSPPKYHKFSFLKIFFVCILSITIITIIVGYSIIFNDLPSAQDLTTRNPQVSTKIHDRNGILLYTIYKDENRTPVRLEDIPKHAVLATLAIEDAEFYSHPGFSIKGISRALLKNYQQKTLYGGSTITQQLVKNTLLSSEKTIIRKLRELVLAMQVEYYFEKDEILEMYLNEVSYGGTAYGIQEASQTYFAKDAGELTLAESALLAGLPKSPTKYSPFGHNSEYAKGRQAEVLKLMEINGFITQEQREEAERFDIKYSENKIDIKAPHFVMFVRDELEKNFGKEVVEKGGLNVITTLDYQIQTLAEKVVKEEVENLTSLHVTNASVIVLEPESGEILAMVGSKDYFDISNEGNVNATLSLRQPGSSIKVITYAYALENGMSASSIIADTPVSFAVAGQSAYTPKNYDGTYRGNLTVRNALAESRNIPAVKVMSTYGVDNIIDLGKRMGITTWEDKSRFGLSLTLGGGEVKLIDLARVYATLANYGRSPKLNFVREVTNYKGVGLEDDSCVSDNSSTRLVIKQDVLANDGKASLFQKESGECEAKQVLDERVAFVLTDILKDNNARTPAFGSRSSLVIPNHPEVAVKTGTSNNLRDNLTVGYNQDYVVAVWVGNNDNSPMSRVASGVTGASPIWNKIMTGLLANTESTEWRTPQGLVQLPICVFTGTLACSGCPVVNEWFIEENKPTRICNPQWFEEGNTDSISRVEGRILPEAASTSN